jgi:transposase
VPADHPLCAILPLVDAALTALTGEFAKLYALNGRPSIPPEKLLRALLLQAFYSVSSERHLMGQLDYNLLFHWFVSLGVDGGGLGHGRVHQACPPARTVDRGNRYRLLEGEIAARFLGAVLDQPQVKTLLSDEHFSHDGTLIQASASMKSFRPKGDSGEPPALGRNGECDFHGKSARTRPTLRRRTLGPGSAARAGARKPSPRS